MSLDPPPVPAYAAIVAMARNRAIGIGGKIPWHLPGDLRFFKQTTIGAIVLMGRRTFESIGHPLPGRENWVLTRSVPQIPGARIFSSVAELPYADPLGRTIYVIGGAEIYSALAPCCAELLITEVPLEPEADTFLPPIESRYPKNEIIFSAPEFLIRRYHF